ncbi:hypothetical protein ACKAV7_013047 [Fusarium commune]
MKTSQHEEESQKAPLARLSPKARQAIGKLKILTQGHSRLEGAEEEAIAEEVQVNKDSANSQAAIARRGETAALAYLLSVEMTKKKRDLCNAKLAALEDIPSLNADAKDSVLLDLAAIVYIFNDLSRFTDLTAAAPGDYLWAGISQVAIDGYGSVKVRLIGAKGTYITLRLDDVVYCEKFTSNLVSFLRLRRRGIWWDISPGNNCLRRSDHSLIGSLEEVHNQQVIEYRPLAEEPTAEAVMTAASSDTDIPRRALRNAYTSHTRRKPIRGSELTWHHRLGHPGPDAIRRLANASRGVRLTVGDRVTTTTCSACA